MFVVISCLLIYSLLMISVEEKRFDAGIMRLLGLSKRGYVLSILFQSLMFVLPSVLIGYFLSYPCLYYIWDAIFKGRAADYNVGFVPTWQATVVSILLGVLIPLVSAIIPIKLALKKTLAENLDTSRARLSGVKISVKEGE